MMTCFSNIWTAVEHIFSSRHMQLHVGLKTSTFFIMLETFFDARMISHKKNNPICPKRNGRRNSIFDALIISADRFSINHSTVTKHLLFFARNVFIGSAQAGPISLLSDM